MKQPFDHTAAIAELEIILAETKQEKKETFDKPYMSGVVYSKPNSDDSRKNCKNCALWVTTQNCLIHPRSLVVSGDEICGHHLHGKPRAEWLQLEGIDPLDPKFSGVQKADGGASCDSCVFYREDGHKCSGVVSEGGELATVEALGRCSRWERK